MHLFIYMYSTRYVYARMFKPCFEIFVSVLVSVVAFWYQNQQYRLFIGHFVSSYWQ